MYKNFDIIRLFIFQNLTIVLEVMLISVSNRQTNVIVVTATGSTVPARSRLVIVNVVLIRVRN